MEGSSEPEKGQGPIEFEFATLEILLSAVNDGRTGMNTCLGGGVNLE